MLFFIICLIAGVLTVLAPCILPLLPIIIGRSLDTNDKGVNIKKMLTVILSLGVSVIVFTLLLKASTLFINIPESTWKYLSGGLIIIFGLITLFPNIWSSNFLAKLSIKFNIILGKGNSKKSFWGDVIVGSALGPVFSTCSPTYFIVIASILPVKPLAGIVYILAYVLGLCLSLLFIAFIGQKLMNKLNIAADPNGIVKKILGIIFVLVGIAVIFSFDKQIQVKILEAGFFDVTKIEQKLLQKEESLNKNNNTSSKKEIKDKSISENMNNFNLIKNESDATLAPELSSIDGYINTDGEKVELKDLRGKIILLDVWTYSCINCQRTLPYINSWYEKYKDDNFVVIGLHTPEFAFEKLQKNVEEGVKKFGIKYPVVLDNDYSTWNDYGNKYWPRKYLINENGYIIYDHIGEGSYQETEKAIQQAINKRNASNNLNKNISKNLTTFNVNKTAKELSPETYFGSNRNENKNYLLGKWDVKGEYAESISNSEILFDYKAKDVYFVAESYLGATIEIYLDNVLQKEIEIKDPINYKIVDNLNYKEGKLKIKVKRGYIKAFTFTFG